MNTPLANWPASPAISEIAALVRREGHRQYTSCMEEGLYQAMLCGLTVTFARGGIPRYMKAHNIELALKGDMHLDFVRGDELILAAWHRHLNAYRASIHSNAAPLQAPTMSAAAIQQIVAA